jgi:hypothetical protein
MTHESGCDPTETLSSGFCPRKADAPLALTTSAISSAIAHRPRSDARSSSISCARIMTGRSGHAGGRVHPPNVGQFNLPPAR